MESNSILQLITLIALCYLLPGYAAWMAIGSQALGRRTVPWPVLVFTIILASVLWTSWLGIVLLQVGLYSFSSLAVITSAASLGLLAWGATHGREWLPRPRPLSAESGLLGLLLVLAAVLFFHPHEYLVGGADAGVYVNLGASIHRLGSWVVHNDIIANTDEVMYETLFRRQPPSQFPEFLQFPGFYLTNPDQGEITPQFFPLHPLWLAVWNTAGGVRSSLFATPIWGLLGVWATALVARDLFGRRCGLLSFLLLSLTATQIWFSRYPTAEALTLYLLSGGMWALARYLDEESVWYGALAGTALGLSLLTRLDLYFLVLIPVMLLLQRLVTAKLRRTDLAFVVTFGALFGQSLAFAVRQSWPYFSSVYGKALERVQQAPVAVVCGIGVCSLVAVVLVRYFRVGGPGQSAQVQRRLTVGWANATKVLAVVVVVAALYAYFLRPALADARQSWYYWYGDYEVANVESHNFVRLGWYLTPLGLVSAVAGMWLVLWHRVGSRVGLFVGVGLFYSVLFLANSRNNPHHIYVMRRYVPVVIPYFVVMMSVSLDWLCYRRQKRVLGIGLTGALAAWLLGSAALPLVHIEYAGVIEQLENLTEELGPPPAIVLVNDEVAVGVGAFLGTPLTYLYGYTVFDLQEMYIDPRRLSEQVNTWRAEGYRVLLAEGPSSLPEVYSAFEAVPIVDSRIAYPALEVSYEHRPRQIWQLVLQTEFFEVVGIH